MPNLVMYADATWSLPHSEDDPLDPEGDYSSEQQATYVLGRNLPGITAKVLNDLDIPTKPGLVQVRFSDDRIISDNPPNIWVVLRPVWSEERAKVQVSIRKGLLDGILQFFRLRAGPSPEIIDVDIDFQLGCGGSLHVPSNTRDYWP